MPPLYLTESDVDRLLDVKGAIAAVESSLVHQADGEAVNRPRGRLNAAPGVHLATMSAADVAAGAMGFKTYTAARGAYRFFVFLSDVQTGKPLAIVEANRLGQLRTGAAGGVAAKFMARADSETVAVIGSGYQARTQLEAVCETLPAMRRARVHSRSEANRTAYAAEMSERLGVPVVPAASAREAVDGADVIITATSSPAPVLLGEWLEAGTFIAAIGGADPYSAEIDAAAVQRADVIAVDDRDQAKIESGELLMPASKGLLLWERTVELNQIVGGRAVGRPDAESVTLFKSLGMALWDVAAAKAVYDMAIADNSLPPSFPRKRESRGLRTPLSPPTP